MADKDKFKPLPKPVAVPPRAKKTSFQANQSPPPPSDQQYINTDDFELPPRKPRMGKRKPPTFSEALIIFFKRLAKRTVTLFYRPPSQQPIHTEHTRQNKRAEQLRKLRRQKIARLLGVASFVIVLVAVAVLLLMRLTGDNAYAVYFDDDKENIIGYVPLSEDVNNAKIQEQAIAKLEEALGAKVKTDQTVNIEPVNIGAKNISEYDALVDLVNRSFTYKIAGVSLIAKGLNIVVLRSEEEIKTIEERLWAPYTNENTKEASFVEEWSTVTKLVDADELGTVEDALLQLDTNHRSLEDYVIKQGETISAIAIKNNTTIDKITADTPGLTDPSKVSPGDIIKLETTRPFLSVRTVDEVTRKRNVPMQTTEENNPSQPSSYRKVIQEGRDGEVEEVVRTTRVNGVIESEEVIEERPLTEPITRVEEVGTGG